MTPLEQWMAANEHSAFPPNIEGYWRTTLEVKPPPNIFVQEQKALPFPVVYQPEGYDKVLFVVLLREMEKSPFTKSVAYRGISMNRLTGEMNGNREYERGGWKWPQGYINYMELDVPPSRAFYKFITTLDCPSLPTYGRN